MEKKHPMIEVKDPSGKAKQIELNDEEDVSLHWSKPLRFRWTITYFIGSFFVYSIRTSMSICAPAIAKEMGWSKQISGMALSAFFCGYVSTNVLGGYLADRHGGERMIIYSTAVWATATLLLPFLADRPNFMYSGTYAILGARFLTGMAQGFFYPSQASIVAKHVPQKERAFMSGFAYSGASLGLIVTGFLGSLIIETIGWEWVFVVLGLPTLMWVVWMRYLYYSTSPRIRTQQQKNKLKPTIPWSKLAMSRPVWGLTIAYFCSGFVFYTFLSWTPVYFHDVFPESKGWVFNVVPWVINFFVTNISCYYANVLLSNGMSVTALRKYYAAVMFLGFALFSCLLTVVESFKQALFVMSMNIAVNAFSSPSIGLNSQDLCPRQPGALHGFVNSLAAIAGIVGVYVTGYILETTGSWFFVYSLAAVVSVIGFLGFQFLGSGEPVKL